MMKNEYNGWSNKQTWNIGLTYVDIFNTVCEDHTFDDVEHLAEAFGELVTSLEMDGLKEYSLAWQAVGEYLDRVNWEEIAGKWFEGGEISNDDAVRLTELRDMLAAE